jgi:hypothetical protein
LRRIKQYAGKCGLIIPRCGGHLGEYLLQEGTNDVPDCTNQAFDPARAGSPLCAPAAWAFSRLIRLQLFAILPAGPAITALDVAGIAAVAALSAYLPARRATGIDPMRAL